MKKISKFLSIVLAACMIFGMLPALSASAAEGEAASSNFMEIVGTGNNSYLSTVGSNAFNVLMYNNTFSGTFGDQHMGGIELSLNGLRIATNGDMHMLPTPEQWDATPAPSRGTRVHDEETGTITIPMTFTGAADGTLLYDLVAASTDGGVKMSMILRSDMPESLIGKARFNLELLPSAYRNKGFQADTDGDGAYDDFGVFPLHPQDPMVDVERPNLPSQAFYVKQWHEDRGDDQPLPFAVGYGFNMAAEGQDYGISFESTTGDIIELYDGRNRAQNGWYVLSTLISATREGETAIEWIIKPDVDPDWVREPNVGFSQVGYTPYQEKFAVVELDKWDNNYPKTMSLWRVNADGSEEKVCEKELGETTAWMRFKYTRFDFTEVNEVGLYRIHYGDYKGEVFPIAKTVYDRIWQTCLSGFMAVQMDHISVREGYKIWHGAAHMDDLSFGPAGLSYFDGQSTPASLPDAVKAKGHTEEVHIDGVNKGGWFDAGDFDIQTSRNTQVLGYFIDAAESWDNMEGYDDLTVVWDDETGGTVEMHRPDGVPDVVQQVVHGAKQIIAQYDVLGIIGGTVEVRTLRQYTHLGDPSSDTDGWIYDPELGPGDVVEKDGKVYSGVPDDRYMMLGRRANNNPTFFSNATSFAATAYIAAPYYPEFAQYAMKAANDVWYKEHMEAEPTVSGEWNQLVQFTLATKRLEELGIPYAHQDELNYAYYKARLDLLADEAVSGGIGSRVNCLYIMDIMDDEYRAKCAAAAEAVADGLTVNTQPYGVNFTSGSGWGGSPNTYSGVRNISMIYHFFPNEKFKQNILRSVDYLLGRHPATNASWISGIGTKSAMHPYNSNRAEESYIPGSILPGHITFSDYVESMDDFSFLWFEGESIINYQSSWLPVGIAAGAIARAEEDAPIAETKDFESSFDAKLVRSGSDGYFEDDGFDVFMYSTQFDRGFGDQHCAGIELIQDGRRIATNGDIHLLPTPEQWDATPAPQIGTRTFDEETQTITVPITMPAETFTDGTPENPAVTYSLIATPEPGGIKLTCKLDAPLPADVVGKAGFNLEFLPAVYIEKSYMADSDGDGTYDQFGVFPRDPRDQMEDVERARTNNQEWYVKEWNEDRGNAQPVPFATGTKMTFAAEYDEYRIRISCDDGLALYDGRNRAQNGWYVLRTLIPAGKTEIVWHISPDTDDGWTREPSIAHSQAGYEPELEKVAVLELDPNYVGSDSATLKRLNDVGEYVTVAAKPLGEAKSWQRYVYKDFDFSDVKEPGMYVIEYDGVVTDPFPIKKGVYKDIWAESIGNYMAVQMDHMRIREGYKIWRNAAHMDDALQAPTGMNWFDAGQNGRRIDTGYEPYERIPGLDVGGFSDAGDFDIQTGQNLAIINSLAMAYQVFGNDYDTLDVNWETNNVELHRSDKIPDLVELVKHGALNILAQNANIGFLASVIEVPTLRQYTHLGDGSKDTDNLYYDASLAEDEVEGRRSGKRDDRLAFAFTKSTSRQLSAAQALGAAAAIVKPYDAETANKFIAEAEKIWAEEESSHASGTSDWNAAIELFNATGKDVYKDRIMEMFETQMATNAFGRGGWRAIKVLDRLGGEAKEKYEAAIAVYGPTVGAPTANNPFGVANTNGMWGGAGTVASNATTAAVLHKYYPEYVSADSVFRAINYLLGTHPYNDTSWVSGVGTNSLKKGYGSNRADFFYIAGGLAPGYVTIKPNFPEALDDFNFLWFENEYTIQATSDWILLSLGAEEFARESDPAEELKLGPNVIKDPDSPTGYTVKFLYKNDTATAVNFNGDISLRNDADRSDTRTYDPTEYRPGLMRGAGYSDKPMEKRTFVIDGEETEVWYYEVPLACGANQYWFTTPGSSTMIADPANTPIWSPTATQKNGYNYVYVPYDAKQDYDVLKAREVENPRKDKKGTWSYVPIEIGGRTHHAGVYLPYGYQPKGTRAAGDPYKTIYILHGGGQDESDWMNIGSVQNIMDNLAAEGRTEPAVIVSPTTNNNMLGGTGDAYANLFNVVIPFIEEHYNVSTNKMDRAFGGLSMGSMNTQNIINANTTAEKFGYYGPWSGGVSVQANAAGIEYAHILFAGGSNDFGWSASAGQSVENLINQGVFADYMTVTGAHDFNTWCQMFRIWCEDYLWKPEAFGDGGETDTAALEAKIAEAEAIDTTPYTDRSVANLIAAIDAAKDAVENAINQRQLDKALEDLENAIARLKEKPSDAPKGDFVLATEIEAGKKYVIVSNGYALTNEVAEVSTAYGGVSLASTPVTVEDGKITSQVTSAMVWDFTAAASSSNNGFETGYILTSGDSKFLARNGPTNGNPAPLNTETYDESNYDTKPQYCYWVVQDLDADGSKAVFCTGTGEWSFALRGAEAGFDAPGNASAETIASQNPVKLYELVAPAGLPDIDFTDPAEAAKFEIVNQNQSAIEEGEGLALIATRPAFEDCKGQNSGDQATIPEDVVVVPVSGDWTATLEVDFSTNGANNGYYQFFGFYAAQGDDFQNLAGIRGGDGAMQNFERHDGVITHQDEDGVNSAPGFASNGTYFLRIEKEGDTYTCYRSNDGEDFDEMFAYAGSGIEADSIVIDAYTGMTTGYKFTLKKLAFEGGGQPGPGGDEVPIQHPEIPIWENTEYSFAERAADLIARMSLAQKGSQLITTPAAAIPASSLSGGALNVPSTKDLPSYYWWCEALHGYNRLDSSSKGVYARNHEYEGIGQWGPDNAVSYPMSLTVGNTWNPDLYYTEALEVGDEIRELTSRNPNTGNAIDLNFYSPTVNLQRDPRWGRNEESYSEDPYLTARMASQYVQGLEGKDQNGNLLDPDGYYNAHSTIKHFVANNSEANRTNGGAVSSLNALRNYYMSPYRSIIKATNISSVMTAYSTFNGEPCSYSSYLMDTLLRQVYGFQGYFTSDCDSVGTMVQHTRFVNPRTGKTLTNVERLATALAHGEDLECIGGYAGVGNYGSYAATMVDAKIQTDKGLFTENTFDVALMRLMTARIATGEFEDDLQLTKDAAARTQAQIAALGEGADISAIPYNQTPERLAILDQVNNEGVVMLQNKDNFLPLRIPASGEYKVVIVGAWQTNMYLGLYSAKSTNSYNHINIQKGITDAILAKNPNATFTYITSDTVNDSNKEAIQAADVVVVVGGANGSYSQEGRDRTSLAMANNQAAMFSQVGKWNPNTVAVMEYQGPLETYTFRDDVKAMLWSSFGGIHKGVGFGNIIVGNVNPSGKLTATWFRSAAELPPTLDYTLYATDDQVGRTYMFYEGDGVDYPFGYGLSFTSYEYSNLKIDKTSYDANDTIKVSFDVKNTGSVAGKETAQLYIAQPGADPKVRPIRRLEGFQKVELQPGETKTVSLEVKIPDLAYYNEADDCYAVDTGAYQVQVGKDSASLGLTADFTVTGAMDVYPQTLTVKANAVGDSEKGIEERLIYDMGSVINPQVTVAMNNEQLYGYIIADQQSLIKSMSSTPLPEGMTVSYKSNRSSVAKVEGGKIIAAGPGVATITATATLDGRSVSTDFIVYVESKPQAVSITLDGEPLEGFEKDKYLYEVEVARGSATPVVAAVAASDALELTVKQPAAVPGIAEVIVHDPSTGASVTYQIGIGYKPVSTDFSEGLAAAKAKGWNFFYENSENYAFGEDGLTLTPVSGEFGFDVENPVANVFVESALGDWVAETTLTPAGAIGKTGATHRDEAGLIVYGDNGTSYRVVYNNRWNASNGVITYQNSRINVYLVVAGNDNNFSIANASVPAGTEKIHLRMIRTGNTCQAQWSSNGTTWSNIGNAEPLDTVLPQVGVFARGNDFTATFDGLNILKVSDIRPQLAELNLDGKTVEGFEPGVYSYNLKLREPTDHIPVLTAVPTDEDLDVEITQFDAPTGVATVVVKSAVASATYSVALNYGPSYDYLADGADGAVKGKGFVPTADSVLSMPAQGTWAVVAKAVIPDAAAFDGQSIGISVAESAANSVNINVQGANLLVQPSRTNNGTASTRNFTTFNLTPDEDGSATVYFKIDKDPTSYTVYASEDGVSFRSLGSVSVTYVNPTIELRGVQTGENPAAFEYVAVPAEDGFDAAITDYFTWAAQSAADYIAADLPAETAEDLALSPAPHGYTVALSSSDPAVISAGGKVYPALEDRDVAVTVTVSDGAVSASAARTIRVPGTGSGQIPEDLEELYRLAREALARAQAAQKAAEDALKAAQEAGGIDTAALAAATEAAEAARKAAEDAKQAAEAAKAAAAASDADAAAKAAQAAASAAAAAEQAAKAAQAQSAAQIAQAAAEAAQQAAEAAAAMTAADKTAAEAARKAAEDAKQAAEAAKAAAQAADTDAASKAAASAASAAEAARALAGAQAAQAAAEAAEKAAREAQVKAEQAAAQAGDDAAAAEAAKAAAQAAQAAAENAKAAAETAKAAAAASNTAAAEAAASAAQSAAEVAEARRQIADAQAQIAAIQAKTSQAAAEAAAAKAAAEAALKAAEAAELSAARYYAKATLTAAIYDADVPVEQKDAFDAAADAGRAALEAAGDKAAIEKALADALKALEAASVDTCPSRNFTDVPPAGNWAHAGIDYCVANGLMNGIDKTTFAPESSTTRAQFATILYRAAGEPAAAYKGTFSDVADGQWYSKAVEWAAANGIVNGVGEGKFNPDGKITREQIAAILYRYSKSPKVEGDLKAFRDAGDVSDYAVDAMIWAVKEGIINGVGEGSSAALAPKANATRAQIATIFARYLTK